MPTVLTPALKYEIVELIDDRIRERHVTKEDFTELKNIVRDIAWEQKYLAEAQKRTESRVEELAEAQKRTESKVEELVQVQKETQEEIKTLTIALNYTRRDLGGVTATQGFMLENEAYRALPDILKSRYGIEVKERFLRRSIRSFGIDNEGEVNIFNRGVDRNREKEIVIIGEARSQPGKDDVDDLMETVDRLKEIDKEAGRFLLLVTHYTKERVIEYAKEKGVEVIQSFEW